MPVQAVLRRHESLHRPVRNYYEPQPQRRQHALRECAYIEYDIRVAGRPQRLQWAGVITKFPVVDVFDHASATVSRELDERLTAARRHCHAEGKLMGWTYADHANVARELFDDQSFLVDPNWYESCACGGERHPHWGIAGILDSDDSFVARDECPGQQIEPLLRPGGDENVVRLAHHRARQRDVPGARFAEVEIALVALRTLVARGLSLQSSKLPGADATEDIK